MLRVDLPPGILAMRAHSDKVSIDFDTPALDIAAVIEKLRLVRDVTSVGLKATTIVVEHTREHSTERVKRMLVRALEPHLAESTGTASTETTHEFACTSCVTSADVSEEGLEITLEEALGMLNQVLPSDLEIVIRKRA